MHGRTKTVSCPHSNRNDEVVMEEWKSVRAEIKRRDEKHKKKNGFLVVHREQQNENADYRRIVVPEKFGIRSFTISELHYIPISDHPRVNSTISKVQQSFF